MNYQKIYDQICQRGKHEAKDRILNRKNRVKYYESHHILPKCMGGSGLTSQWKHENIVLLTAREHFLCHWLLHEINPTNFKLAMSFWNMCNGMNKSNQKQNTHIPSSRIYEMIRAKISKITSNRMMGSNNPSKKDETKKKMQDHWTNERKKIESEKKKCWHSNLLQEEKKQIKDKQSRAWTEDRKVILSARMKTNNPYSNPDVVEKIRQKKIGKSRPDMKGDNAIINRPGVKEKSKSSFRNFLNSIEGEMYKENLSKKMIGDNNPSKRPEISEKIKNSLKDRFSKLNQDDRNKSASFMNNKKITCEHCGIETNSGNYKRWHGTNCKIK